MGGSVVVATKFSAKHQGKDIHHPPSTIYKWPLSDLPRPTLCPSLSLSFTITMSYDFYFTYFNPQLLILINVHFYPETFRIMLIQTLWCEDTSAYYLSLWEIIQPLAWTIFTTNILHPSKNACSNICTTLWRTSLNLVKLSDHRRSIILPRLGQFSPSLFSIDRTNI